MELPDGAEVVQSMLAYQQLGTLGGVRPLLLGVHGRGSNLQTLVPMLRAVDPECAIITPQAPRPASPPVTGAPVDGYTWYLGGDTERPEPATFGEGLWQLEQFVLNVRSQSPTQEVVAVGQDQGAVLALTLACVNPVLFSRVVAISGALPEIPRWTLPVEDLRALPVLLIEGARDGSSDRPAITRTLQALTERGADVAVRHLDALSDLTDAAPALLDWLAGDGVACV